MNIDWSKAPEGAEAGYLGTSHAYDAWYKRAENGEVWQICPAAGFNDWVNMGGRKDFPVGAVLRPVSVAWTGEGLPPVGTVCLVEHPVQKSRKVKILAHWHDGLKAEVAVYIPLEGTVHCDQAIAACFRPIRTPEQIAAEEREERLVLMSHAYQDLTGRSVPAYIHEAFRALDDAGYRKFEIVEGK